MATAKQPDPTIQTPPEHPDHEQELLDEAIQESFPASDPISISVESPEARREREAREDREASQQPPR